MRRSLRAAAAAALAAGCADRRHTLGPPPAPPPDYRAGCGDVLAVRFAGHPGWDGIAAVAADGALPLGPVGPVPADRRSLPEVQQAAAAAVSLPAEAVSVELLDPRAGVIYLAGPGGRRLRAVPHVGAETVSGFLHRAGVVTLPAADLAAVTVTRPDPAGGGPPLTVAVNPGADVPLFPGDTVTVGESWQARLADALPGWLAAVSRAAGSPPTAPR